MGNHMINKESAKKKAEEKKAQYKVEVTRAKDLTKEDGKTCIAFDMTVNDIKIYGCTYREGTKDGKDWNLVDFPSIKGKDDKYYHRVWFPVSKELCDEISKQIESKLK